MAIITENELKAKLHSSGWTFHDICAIKCVNAPFEVLDSLMPKLYAATGFDKYELFLEDIDDSSTSDPGEIIFDYTCWDVYVRRNADSETAISQALAVLCDIDGFLARHC
ncbi:MULTISPECIES: hypothetical protein [Methylomonas]|uniref:Uncharacterized protein n=1 Tax=Methylomonas koyamae TaxID=702114 RepID=A0A177NN94_9GAMM|nr:MULTISPECIES: hypothetical protein [Methylomonas]ANE56772.1 hypothetical protein AYM39_17375 [Methylomonas sp. DH-1]ATG91719.1 hypothetical protein MKLM6_3532 [Methylomonas koyamae]OAI19351.1 hypothetical protein A1507_07255 [Methylomonas koyamae]